MPKNSNVGRCVSKVEKQGKDKVAAIKICQKSTGQAYATGKPPKKKMDESMEKKKIVEFIKNVVDNDFSAANKTLQSVIDEKLKSRIRNYNASVCKKDTENSK